MKMLGELTLNASTTNENPNHFAMKELQLWKRLATMFWRRDMDALDPFQREDVGRKFESLVQGLINEMDERDDPAGAAGAVVERVLNGAFPRRWRPRDIPPAKAEIARLLIEWNEASALLQSTRST
jgi:hypothetical protein